MKSILQAKLLPSFQMDAGFGYSAAAEACDFIWFPSGSALNPLKSLTGKKKKIPSICQVLEKHMIFLTCTKHPVVWQIWKQVHSCFWEAELWPYTDKSDMSLSAVSDGLCSR